LLRSVGLDVSLVGRSGRQGGPGEGRIFAIVELDSLLPRADWLIIAAPLTADTEGLIGARELRSLPPRARLINIGRGPIVVEDALAEAVACARLAGAALDVFEDEPLPCESPLWSLPTVIVSPHTGGTTEQTPALLSAAFRDNLQRYVAGQPLQAIVDKRLGFVRSSD
jgi:phosphoglycerate dehydrogenase-like enzyme